MISSYNGNTNLKKIGEKIEWTKDMVDEYRKCSSDPIHFIKEHCKIIHVDLGLIPFNLYDYQINMIGDMYDNRNNIILSTRQSGKCHGINTTVTVRNKKTGEIETITVGELYDEAERELRTESET